MRSIGEVLYHVLKLLKLLSVEEVERCLAVFRTLPASYQNQIDATAFSRSYQGEAACCLLTHLTVMMDATIKKIPPMLTAPTPLINNQ
jgi:hypothetical protein